MAFAGEPRVRFDMPGMIAAHDVTPLEFASANPGEKLVEVVLPISSLIGAEGDDRLLQFIYRLESPHSAFEVVDFLPKTTLTTRFASPIGHQRSQEQTNQLGLSLTGNYPPFVSSTGNAGTSTKTSSSVRYELLPPLELLAASGTMERGSGVFFKLKPSPRTSLEGSKDFAMVLRVPANWRGDCLWVTCEALSHSRSALSFESSTNRQRSEFVVALYLNGDEEAKRAATRLFREEQSLRRAASKHAEAIRGEAQGNWPQKIGVLLAVSEPRVAEDWLPRLIAAPAGADIDGLTRTLPPPVRTASGDYVSAKLALRALSGGPSESPRHWARRWGE